MIVKGLITGALTIGASVATDIFGTKIASKVTSNKISKLAKELEENPDVSETEANETIATESDKIFTKEKVKAYIAGLAITGAVAGVTAMILGGSSDLDDEDEEMDEE